MGVMFDQTISCQAFNYWAISDNILLDLLLEVVFFVVVAVVLLVVVLSLVVVLLLLLLILVAVVVLLLSVSVLLLLFLLVVVMVLVVMVLVVVMVEPMCIFWARKALERVLQAPFPRCDTHNGSRIIASWPKIKN